MKDWARCSPDPTPVVLRSARNRHIDKDATDHSTPPVITADVTYFAPAGPCQRRHPASPATRSGIAWCHPAPDGAMPHRLQLRIADGAILIRAGATTFLQVRTGMASIESNTSPWGLACGAIVVP
ncbi:hypothetical protein [Streptomyces subrutilus]|uniref:hypothetical protein n=1 Tax=Streptomyces subrutilus TaxID=36818 RepID=UPI0033EB42FC